MSDDQVISKARTLEVLEKQQRGFVVDPFLTFTVGEWRRFPRQVLAKMRRKKLGTTVIVRSAVLTEDSEQSVPPGTYHSELNVPTGSDENISTAIEKVIASYNRHWGAVGAIELDEVLIQRQVLSPRLSGIIMSNDYNSETPYYAVEYDDETGRTDWVTAGHSCKKAYIFRKGVTIPFPWNVIARAARSVEQLLGFTNLVIEFALAEGELVHIFQARRMPVAYQKMQYSETSIAYIIRRTQGFIRKHPSTIWSNMADWNPAEMLGEHPKPLDSSLYCYLITDGTWAKARASLGYRDVTPKKLIDDIAGYPYINIESSFESLCPAALPDTVACRLVGNRVAALRNQPELHDKVELEVMFTCADVVQPARTQVLVNAGFPAQDIVLIEHSLISLTSSLLTTTKDLLSEDMRRRRKLMNWLQSASLLARNASNPSASLDSIVTGLVNCRDLGVFSFSRLARLAFVGRDILERLVVAGALSRDEYECFWRSINTVASHVAAAVRDLSNGRTTKPEFDKTFGHLRPHTYDITSPRYDQSELVVQDPVREEATLDKQSPELGPGVYRSISKCLSTAGLPPDAEKFLSFVSVSVREREQSKFEFSAVLSACLEAIANLGETLEISRSELSFITVNDILEAKSLRPKRSELKRLWTEKKCLRSTEWQKAERIRLPSLITEPDDLVVVRPTKSKPNFITSREAEGQIIILNDSLPSPSVQLSHKIVILETADPGYDWIFSSPIAALVTKYGGAASHMAIRAAQFGIPAVIGCGNELYNEFCIHKRVRINCGKREIEFSA